MFKRKLLKEAIQQILLVKIDVNIKCLYKRYSFEDEKTSIMNITTEQLAGTISAVTLTSHIGQIMVTNSHYKV